MPLVFLPGRARAARNAIGISQEALADRMTGILRQRDPTRWNTRRLRARQILRWEHGQHEPRGEFVEVMALATDREIEFFYGDEDEEEAAQMRRHARELIAPFNDSMVSALLAECQARVELSKTAEVVA